MKKSGPLKLPTITGLDNAANVTAARSRPYNVGDVPPSTIYRVALRRLYLTENRKRADVMRIVWEAEIDEGGSPHNGYTLSDGQNFDLTGLPYINRMLDAFGLDRTEFHGGGVKTEKDGATIRKVGRVSVRPSADLRFYVGTRRKRDASGSIFLAFYVFSDENSWRAAQ